MPFTALLIVLFCLIAECQANGNAIYETTTRCLRTFNDSALTPSERKVANSPIPIIMTRNEKVLLHQYLQKSKFFFEFGCGGSTMLACQFSPHLFIRSFDSSKPWVERVANDTCVKQAISSGRMQITYVDIGAVGDWGTPSSPDHKDRWSDYSEAIKSVGPQVDFVLVDGRFRVASCLKAILYTNREKVVIAIHDFFERTHYHTVLKYADVIDCQNSLVILKTKHNADLVALEKDIAGHVQNYARRL